MGADRGAGGHHCGRPAADVGWGVVGRVRRALLVLEDGAVFEGRSIGHHGTCAGEVVFSTSMTGYQETLTDPSYACQILTLTYPLIGNYGAADEDFESRAVQVAGLVALPLCYGPSHLRSGATPQRSLGRHRA